MDGATLGFVSWGVPVNAGTLEVSMGKVTGYGLFVLFCFYLVPAWDALPRQRRFAAEEAQYPPGESPWCPDP